MSAPIIICPQSIDFLVEIFSRVSRSRVDKQKKAESSMNVSISYESVMKYPTGWYNADRLQTSVIAS